MATTVKDYKDHRYLASHFCLHYHIWNSSNDICSQFVTLCTFNDRHPHTQLYINVAEMWMACVFQTLTPPHLDLYLPADVTRLWAGHHLNVALPLWQSFTDDIEDTGELLGGRQTFKTFLQSKNPAVRSWATNLRDAFNGLRDSPDPAILH
jgi:hypothetical protein